MTCQTNDSCADEEYCSKPVGKCLADGKCARRPEICTQEYRPVCGCDGRTYPNGCNAAAAGVNVARDGECD